MAKKKSKNNRRFTRRITILIIVEMVLLIVLLFLIFKQENSKIDQNNGEVNEQIEDAGIQSSTKEDERLDGKNQADEPERDQDTAQPGITPETTPEPTLEIAYNAYEARTIAWNPEWEYAGYSKINSSSVTLYESLHEGRKVIAINAGHGTKGGSSVKTLCHPDGSAKVTGGSTKKGSIEASAVSSGTTMLDGTAEAVVTLKLALIVKERLLDAGFSVLMIRESEDVQLDNIARTVFANQNADCHIALHYDSSDHDKGFFYLGVPEVESYRNMEPVASHWQQHNALGESLLEGMRANNVKIYGNGNIQMDLTQTSYSTVPSIDVEVGDRGSDYSEETLNKLADGIVVGVKLYFGMDY